MLPFVVSLHMYRHDVRLSPILYIVSSIPVPSPLAIYCIYIYIYTRISVHLYRDYTQPRYSIWECYPWPWLRHKHTLIDYSSIVKRRGTRAFLVTPLFTNRLIAYWAALNKVETKQKKTRKSKKKRDELIFVLFLRFRTVPRDETETVEREERRRSC